MLDFNEDRKHIYLAMENGIASDSQMVRVKLDLLQTTFFSSLDLQGFNIGDIVSKFSYKVIKNTKCHYAQADIIYPIVGRLRKQAGVEPDDPQIESLESRRKTSVIRQNTFDMNPENSRGYTLTGENDCICMFMTNQMFRWLNEIIEYHHPLNKVELLFGSLMCLVPRKLITECLDKFDVKVKKKKDP